MPGIQKKLKIYLVRKREEGRKKGRRKQEREERREQAMTLRHDKQC